MQKPSGARLARAFVIAAVAAVAVTLLAPRNARAARCSDDRDTTAAHVSSTSSHVTQREDADAADDCIPRNIYWMPGISGSFFQPSGNLGPFYGAGVQFAPFQWSHNNDNFGPSQGTMILGASLLRSPRSTGTMAIFEVGATASFERNSSRRWMIPYFGGTFGALTQSELGTSAYMYPLVGGHLYWHENLMIDVQGGYHFPFEDVDRLRGPRGELSMRVSMW
jgi:hypothetical protein